MKLIAGLGNPGKKYHHTRHNIGFEVLAGWPDQGYNMKKKFNSLVLKSNEAIWAMPQTYMNNSGQAILKISKYYKINSRDIWVIHDDIDLPLDTIRINTLKSSAGHLGVESIIHTLGTNDFTRFRLGIMSDYKGQIPTDTFVLHKFDNLETDQVKKIIKKTRAAIRLALSKDLDTSTKKYSS